MSLLDFDYFDGGEEIQDCIRVSPSRFNKLWSNPSEWYRETVEGESNFEGNTATYLGTIVHAIADLVANDPNGNRDSLDDEVEAYLATIPFSRLDINKQEIRSLWRDMSSMACSEYVLHTDYHSTEEFIYHKLDDNLVVGGTYDFIKKDGNGNLVLGDYKTASKKPSSIGMYRNQLLLYAWVLKQKGITIDSIEIVAIVKPTKTMGVRVFTFNEPVTSQDMDNVTNALANIKLSLRLLKTNPEYKDLLFRPQLKENY